MKMQQLIQIAGGLQIVIVIANFFLPAILDYRVNLAKVSPIIRHIFWGHAGYIVLILAGFAAISLLFPEDLCGASGIGRFLSGFLALFWLSRVVVQTFLYDSEVKRAHPWGNAFFTATFLYLGLAYLAAALFPL